MDVGDGRPSPHVQAAGREQLERILQAMSEFADPVRSVLFLRFIEECTIEEIAQVLEMPVGTVKSHIHRGRNQLKRIFSEEECEA